MQQSSDLVDLQAQFPRIREKFLAQQGINTNESEQDALSSSGIEGRSGGTHSGKQTPLPPTDVVEPCQSSFGAQNYTNQSVLDPQSLNYASGLSPGYSTALLSTQGTSSWPQSHDGAASHQLTGACYSHTYASHSHIPANNDSLMSPTQWPYQLPTESPARDYHSPGVTALNTNATQPQCYPIQAIGTRQYQSDWHEDAVSAWAPNQDITESHDTRNDVLDDFMTNEFFDVTSCGLDDAISNALGRDGLPGCQVSDSASMYPG